MNITTELVTGFVGAALGMCALAGMAVRFVLVPYLQKNIEKPVGQIQSQVQNSHSTNLRHDIDDLGRDVSKVDGKVDQLDTRFDAQAVSMAEVKAMLTLMREDTVQHWARQERTNRDLWSAVNRARNPRPPAPPN